MKYDRLVTFAIPTRGYVDPKFMTHMLIVIDQLPTGSSWRVRVTNKDPVTGEVMNAAEAREKLVEECLEEDNSKYIFFIDSDVYVPPNGFAYLLQSSEDIVTGIYWTKVEPPEPVLYKELKMGPYFDFPKNSLFEVQAAGLGCCLIKTEIFEHVPRPWFAYKLKEGEDKELQVTEDFYFFIKARKYGYKLWCNSNVLCYHLKEQLPQKFFPEKF